MSAASVLLINPPIRLNSPPTSVPVGLASIAAVLRRAGHRVDVLDANGLRLSFEQVRGRLGERRYDLVAAGGLITTYKYLKGLFGAVREAQSGALRVIGGGVCVDPRVVLANIDADVCVLGEGEHTMGELAAACRDRRDFRSIAGLAWRGEGGVELSPPRAVESDLDRFPMPAYDLFPTELYHRTVLYSGQANEARLITSRGCPWRCTFCWHIFGPGMRFRGIEAVMEEVRYFRRREGAASLLFADENFTARPSRVLEFCEAMCRNGFHRIPWMCSGRADTLDRRVLRQMRRAGCYRIAFGVESGCQRLLDAMNKRIGVEQMAETFRLCRECNIIPGGTLIFGVPGEDEASVAETVRFCRANRLATGLFFATPFPGTELYNDPPVQRRILARYGTKDRFFEALGDVVDFTVNLTDWGDEEMLRIKRRAEAAIKHQPPLTMASIAWASVRSRGLRRTARWYAQWLRQRLARPAGRNGTPPDG